MSAVHKTEVGMSKPLNDTRIALLEQNQSYLTETLKRLETKIDSGFEKVGMDFQGIRGELSKLDNKLDSHFKYLDSKIDSNFKWLIGTIISLFILNGLAPFLGKFFIAK